MRMTDELRRLTAKHTDAVTLSEAARAGGMRTMMDDAREKIALGMTTETEMVRVLS
jgi:type II secretory ATPase GspE/PulE/Tfp pilus assembly ATPase PilB-like protein